VGPLGSKVVTAHIQLNLNGGLVARKPEQQVPAHKNIHPILAYVTNDTTYETLLLFLFLFLFLLLLLLSLSLTL
jgi:hypothetical protein